MNLTIYALVRAEPNLIAALSRWTISPLPGLHIGYLTKRVADHIWSRIESIAQESDLHACFIRANRTSPQGFELRTCGTYRREILELDERKLIGLPPKDLELPQADNEKVNGN